MEVELETFAEEEEETIELGEVKKAWHRNPRDDLRASFQNRGRGAPELSGEHNGPIIIGSSGACGR
jgi:hypothetical protein